MPNPCTHEIYAIDWASAGEPDLFVGGHQIDLFTCCCLECGAKLQHKLIAPGEHWTGSHATLDIGLGSTHGGNYQQAINARVARAARWRQRNAPS